MSSLRKTVSKTLLISIVASSVLWAGFETFRPSCMYCFSVVRRVEVECKALKPWCVCESGTCAVMVLKISFSRI